MIISVPLRIGKKRNFIAFQIEDWLPCCLWPKLIMLGVLYTDWHRCNPIAFSYPSIEAVMSLSVMLLLYSVDKKRYHISSTT
jgi:hypothetical protein